MRVYLRKPTIDDAREFLSRTKESVELHRPWVYPATSLASFREHLARLDGDRNIGFLICRTGDDAILGSVNLNEIVRGSFMSAYVGYWGVAGFAGRGFMTEGVALGFDFAFGTLGLNRLEVNVQPSNQSSLALAKRLGLVKEGLSARYLRIGGQWTDHERWAMLADDWKIRGGAELVLASVRVDAD